jgi:hypothetical protein
MTSTTSAAVDLDLQHEHPTQEADALADVTAQVKADAEDEPEAYLAETIVPHGGE